MIPQTSFLKSCAVLSQALQKIPEPILDLAKQHNPWFIAESVKMASDAWVKLLKPENLERWLEKYAYNTVPKKISIIMAGNIPMVGLHDLISVLASGNNAYCKLSSSDTILMKYCIDNLNSTLETKIEIIERVINPDAVIATGSNNSAKIFETYFGRFPHIIRKNRTSIAVLTGHETPEELTLLGSDIFSYHGLGCRNISKLFVPEAYDFSAFFEAIFGYGAIVNHHKYANNYDYNKAIYLLSLEPFLDNNFLMLRRDEKSFHSPLSVLFYDFYTDIATLKEMLAENESSLQCIASKINLASPRQVALGSTQYPELWDYADGIDTMRFLEEL